MKKKTRTITLEGHRYQYVTASPQLGFVRATIWSLDGKGQILKVVVRFDDPWVNLHRPAEPLELRPVTPGLISLFIQQALAQGWVPTERGRELMRYWNRESEQLTTMPADENIAGEGINGEI